ncbi:phosphotransferase enzyme family protein [Aquiflexum gelatinilyticum]|uniref:Aminoglycoside phosphotransferase family protein n=1 Tax=Aquiflexum gelatinilyticum TaxID=2961943 RepID=A0A9X2PAT1_9BACT|nr:aminoglycoside phosphotransferase family protein [Aquiflexum gelatinilyticum]MCR9016229.1 aminoglycoside phosphotransferase family protein [Aquiflexum gelatinilyticum]
MSSFSWLPTLNKEYGLEISPSAIRSFGDGHIHQTFLIETKSAKLILQRFNNLVFRFPERISQNHAILIDQIKSEELPYILPLPIPNLAGELFTFIDEAYFRISPFVSGKCVNEIENPHLAYLAAKAFALFIKAGIHIPASEFQEAIPGFHDLELRYNQLLEALKNTKRILSGELKELVEFYLGQKDLVDQYLSWKEKLPLRLTHSDTKINNLIFADDFSKVNAVIDLDTLMAGYVYYDFGDLVRTVACTEGEGSKDWEKINVDNAKYNALLEGFLEVGNGVFTEEEINSLSFGGLMMTCIMGFRFLADYLKGNIYYTIHYEEQNLHRAKNQMYLLKGLRELVK